MGCGARGILQKKGLNGTWHTVLEDMLNLGSSNNRELYNVLQHNATLGLPSDLNTFEHEGYGPHIMVNSDPYWLGEYGHCHISLKDFINLPSQKYQGFSVYQDETGLQIHVGEDVEHSFESTLYSMQRAFDIMFFDVTEYRLVIGFDS